MTKSSGKGPPRGRQQKQRVRTARKRKLSSTRWLERQLNDPYVAAAQAEGWRSRAAYKLMQLDDKYKLLAPGVRVVDLGAAPGGWCQVAVARGAVHVVGIDYLEMDPVPGCVILKKDFNDPDAPDMLKAALDGSADLVLSDMAAPTTGHKPTDHLRIMALADLAWHFAAEVLAERGSFVCKVFQGGAERDLLDQLKRQFDTVRHHKPASSRADSKEIYVVAQGFRGA